MLRSPPSLDGLRAWLYRSPYLLPASTPASLEAAVVGVAQICGGDIWNVIPEGRRGRSPKLAGKRVGVHPRAGAGSKSPNSSNVR